jgi:hypothetical protein
MTQNTIRALYKRLIACYPRAFKEQLGESMEQTFNDLCNEKRRKKQPLAGFVLWTFLETAMGICREYLFLIFPGDVMRTILKTLGSSTLIGLLLILPFVIMEVVNRRNLNEEFPVVLFFAMWLNLFAVSSILMPIVQITWSGKQDVADNIPAQGNTLLTNSKSALIISIVLILAPGILPLLNSIGWLSLDRLVNGPNPEVEYLPGLFITVGMILFPIAGGIIASGPIVSALRTGRSVFAHPLHLIIVVALSFLFASGAVSLIVDQWPCFIGVPVCD